MNNIAPKLQKNAEHTKQPSTSYQKMPKQQNFFYNQPSTLLKDAPANCYLSMTFG